MEMTDESGVSGGVSGKIAPSERQKMRVTEIEREEKEFEGEVKEFKGKVKEFEWKVSPLLARD